MSELILALTMLCTKTNDLNMYIIDSRKTCVVKMLRCIGGYKKKSLVHLSTENYADCIEKDTWIYREKNEKKYKDEE